MALLWFRTKPVSLDGDIRATCEDCGAECGVRLSGRITIDSSPALREILRQRLASSGCQTLTLDLHDTTYIDTSGLAILLETLKAAKEHGKTFQLSGLRERPRYVLEKTRLLRLFREVDAYSARVDDSRPGGLF